jgi:hypothetical protein
LVCGKILCDGCALSFGCGDVCGGCALSCAMTLLGLSLFCANDGGGGGGVWSDVSFLCKDLVTKRKGRGEESQIKHFFETKSVSSYLHHFLPK